MKIKPFIPYAIAIAGFLLLWYFFGRGCAGPSHKQDYENLQEENEHIRDQNTKFARQRDSLALVVIRYTEEIDSIKRAKVIVQTKYINTGKVVTKLVSDHRTLTGRNDTAGIISNCDSLANQVESLMGIVSNQETLNEQLISSYDKKIAVKDSIIAGHARQHVELLAAFNNSHEKYNSLYKDYKKVNRKVKTNRTIGRVLAGAVLVLGAKILIK